MLEFNLEFRKGVLFVRLIGDLNGQTKILIDQELGDLVNRNGIKYLVFNVEGLKYIDEYGIDALYHNYTVINKHHGKTMVCGIKNLLVKYRLEHSRLFNYLDVVDNELSAIATLSI